MATLTKFDPKDVKRNKCLAWDPKGNAGKGSGIYTSDLTNEDGTVNTALCEQYKVDPSTVVPLTIADIPTTYRDERGTLTAKSVLKAYTADAGYASPDDAILDLVVSAVMQDLANASVKAHRPVTDKAVSRAASTLRKVLMAQGKSEAEINTVLAAIGQK